METASAVRVEKVAYKGWSNCYRIRNAWMELIVTSDVGPRVLRCGFVGGQNLFKEFPEQLGKSGEGEFRARGGHRLWKAPEDLGSTWIADNDTVEITLHSDGLTAVAPVEAASGLQKEVEIHLAQSNCGAMVKHRIRNCSEISVELAPWALTVMAPGGLAIAGFPQRAQYPDVLLATNPLVMWAYTDFSDARWKLMRKYLALRQDASRRDPQKAGLFSENCWACYLLNGELFVKGTKADVSERYADFGCSLELFTNEEFLELETLGPLRTLASGEMVEHVEQWSLHRDVQLAGLTEEAVDRAIAPLLRTEG